MDPRRAASSLIERVIETLPDPIGPSLQQLRGGDLMLQAAGLAFYALVSFAPFAIVVLWIASLVLGDNRIEEAADTLKKVTPTSLGADRIFQKVSELGTSVGSGAVVTALWPASSYGSGLKRAFDDIGAGNREFNGLRGRLLAVAGLLPAFAVGGLISSYFGTTLLDDGGLSRLIGALLALVTGFVGTAASVVLIYRLFPQKALSGRALLVATAGTASGISVLSLAFTLFLSAGADFKEHYVTSTLAGIVLLALWLYLANALLLAGYKSAVTAR